jgi:phage shock protein PspC (stress-responsive transcriptional regulator)/ribosomal protein L7/L12
MNKTVNINLGGMFFHIDEDAYQKLTRYFDAIKRSLSKSSGQDEIIKDIEMRVSELLTEKQKSEKHVVSIREVDEVITIMGQPEDYIIEEDGPTASNFSDYSAPRATKKLYRDKENGMVSGVCTGLGHYFGIDAVWLKILFLVFVFGGFGTGVLAYIILWVVTPEAITTSEKLEMTGEPVTISNIEKKVREEFENVSNKLKNADYDKFGNQVKSEAEKLGNGFSEFIMAVFTIFTKCLGVTLIMGGLTILMLLFIGVFTLGTSVSMDFPWQNYVEAGNFTDYPIWAFGLLMFLAVGIPFLFMTLLGFRLLAPKIKSVGNIVKYTLLAVWLIAVSIAISIGIKQASAFAVSNRTIEKQTFAINPSDTLMVKFVHNNYFAKDVSDKNNFMITKDSLDNEIIYSTDVHIRIEKSDEKYAYIKVEKDAKGASLSEAKKRADAIKYSYKIIGNQLIFDNYLLTDAKNKFRDQEIEITVYLPEGVLFKTDSSVKHYDWSDDDFFNLHYSSDNYTYKVENRKVKCLDCPDDENDHDDRNDNQTNITINENGVTIKGDTTKVQKNLKELKINKDGIIIKTE